MKVAKFRTMCVILVIQTRTSICVYVQVNVHKTSSEHKGKLSISNKTDM